MQECSQSSLKIIAVAATENVVSAGGIDFVINAAAAAATQKGSFLLRKTRFVFAWKCLTSCSLAAEFLFSSERFEAV